MSVRFEKQFEVGWGNCDFNAHMGNTSYLDFAADTRLAYFAENGFGADDFMRIGFGPVIRSDFVEYFLELRLLEKFNVTLSVSGLSDDASRFRFVNRFFRADGKPVATVTTTGGWLSLKERRLIAPPEELRRVVAAIERTEDFEIFDSSLKI